MFITTIAPGCATPNVPAHGAPIRVGIQDAGAEKTAFQLHEIPMERYVAGVLEKEVHGGWPLEALKAQAVATRTYALYRKEKPRDTRFDVLSDTSDQVFEKSRGHSPAIVQAVTETEGETLTYRGKVFQTFFHSCCGGMSESADQVWPGVAVPPLQGIHQDPYCSTCPPAHWEYRISREDLQRTLVENGYQANGTWEIEITGTDESGRVTEISLLPSKTRIQATKFRQLIGNTNLKSTLFEISTSNDPIVFSGRGAGHGVGLCQWGAKGMADDGRTYREILEFYYPGAEISPSASEPVIDLEGQD